MTELYNLDKTAHVYIHKKVVVCLIFIFLFCICSCYFSVTSLILLMSINHLSADQLTLVSNTCLFQGLKNSVLIAKVSAPNAAGWNPPDRVTQTSAALHVYISSSSLSLSLSVSLFSLFSVDTTGIKLRGQQRVNRGLRPISRLSYFCLLCVFHFLKVASGNYYCTQNIFFLKLYVLILFYGVIQCACQAYALNVC